MLTISDIHAVDKIILLRWRLLMRLPNDDVCFGKANSVYIKKVYDRSKDTYETVRKRNDATNS